MKRGKIMKLNAPVYRDEMPDPLIMGHFVPWFTCDDPEGFSVPEKYASDIIQPKLEPWRHWRNSRSEYSRTHLYQPMYGEYDSRDPVIIRQQIHDAVSYGLNGFIININGKNSVENMFGLGLLEEIKAYNEAHPDKPFLYIISFDSKAQSPTEGKIPVSIEEDFRYLRDVWLTDAWVRNGDKPVLMIFAYNDNYEKYATAADKIFEHGADVIWPHADRQNVRSAYCWVGPDRTEDNGLWLHCDGAGVKHIENFYRDCAANVTSIDYIIGGVWPGFDDTLVRWAWDDGMDPHNLRPRIICRNTTRGNTLELTWRAVAEYISIQRESLYKLPPMPIVQVVTWNDWAEASAVEPDMESGYKNLKICRKYIEAIQKNAGVTV